MGSPHVGQMGVLSGNTDRKAKNAALPIARAAARKASSALLISLQLSAFRRAATSANAVASRSRSSVMISFF
jgi:hypothetical protein